MMNVKDSVGNSQDLAFNPICYPRFHLDSQTVQVEVGVSFNPVYISGITNRL